MGHSSGVLRAEQVRQWRILMARVERQRRKKKRGPTVAIHTLMGLVILAIHAIRDVAGD